MDPDTRHPPIPKSVCCQSELPNLQATAQQLRTFGTPRIQKQSTDEGVTLSCCIHTMFHKPGPGTGRHLSSRYNVRKFMVRQLVHDSTYLHSKNKSTYCGAVGVGPVTDMKVVTGTDHDHYIE
jgi:hypothetical protein